MGARVVITVGSLSVVGDDASPTGFVRLPVESPPGSDVAAECTEPALEVVPLIWISF
jgi:hypothetical protein